MNLTAPLSFIAALALVGCASTPDGDESAQSTRSELELPKDSPYSIENLNKHQADAERIRANWPQLREGLTLDQVNELLGPIDEVSLEHFTEGIDLAREYGLTDSTNTLMNQSPAGLYKLVFDIDGKLVEWSWE